jgi:hypothetical protein
MTTDRGMAYLGAFMLSRWTLIVANLCISYVCLHAVYDVVLMILDQTGHVVHVEVMDGLGTILIGYGVATEERHALRDVAGHLPRIDRAWEAAIDKHSHSQGLLLLVFGLLNEMCMACIHIPSHIVDERGIERHLLALASVLLLICVWVMALYSLRMLRQGKKPAQDAVLSGTT